MILKFQQQPYLNILSILRIINIPTKQYIFSHDFVIFLSENVQCLLQILN